MPDDGWITAEAVKADWEEFSESESGAVCKRTACACAAITGFVTVIALLATSFQKLESKEFGVPYNTVMRELGTDVKTDGLHTGSPGFHFIKFPSTFITVNMPEDLKRVALPRPSCLDRPSAHRTLTRSRAHPPPPVPPPPPRLRRHEDDATCVSKDGLVVKTAVSFQYTVDKSRLLEAVAEYRDFEKFNEMVKAAGVSAVHHGCGEFAVQAFQGKRSEVQARMLEFFRLKIEGNATTGAKGLYSRAVDLQLRNIQLPPAYAQAVSSKQSAEEDIELAKNQRTQSLTAANTALLTARQEAERELDGARNSAQIRRTEAEFRANATLLEYATESETYKSIKEDLKLTNEGFLAYIGNRAIEAAEKPRLRVREPAALSYREEL